MTNITKYFKPTELTTLNASILAYRGALVVAEEARTVLAAEQQRLLAIWEPKLERLKEKDQAARERAEERDQDYLDDQALDDLEALINEITDVEPDETDSALFSPLAVPGAGF